MLDLSYLLPKSRSPPRAPGSSRGIVILGIDMTKSPSFLSHSPLNDGESGRPASQRGDRRSRRKATKESLREELSSPVHAARSQRSAQDPSGLSNLYAHYEQMSFRDVMGRGRARPAQPDESDVSLMSAPSTTSGGGYFASSHATPRPPFSGQESSGRVDGGLQPPAAAIMSPPSTLQSPAVGDCNASVSSRHTRTSKASKRTNQSMGDVDLLQNSILSLESDSEDDLSESAPTKSLSQSATTDAASSPEPWRPGASSAAIVIKPPIRPSAGPIAGQFLPAVPADGVVVTAPMPPVINPRSSSLSLSTVSTAKPHRWYSTRSSSRLSFMSTSTVGSVTQPLRPPHGNSGGYVACEAREARAISMVPANNTSNTSSSFGANSPAPTPTSSDPQLTPPLSPTSVDFYLRSQHSSLLDYDQGSVRSARSMGTVGSGRNSSRASHSRVMAVTRQEEMLLAALRSKRANMRESIIAEFEEEQDGNSKGHGAPDHNQTAMRLSPSGSVTEVLQPKPRRAQSASVSFKHFPMHMSEEPNGPSRVSTQSDPTPTRIGGADDAADNDGDKRERVLLYLDRRPDQSNIDFDDAAEPSPDLSDFMDFDDGGSSDSFPFQTPDDHSPVDANGRGRPRRRDGSKDRQDKRHGGSSQPAQLLGPELRKLAPGQEGDVQVRIVDDDPVDISTLAEEAAGHESASGIPRPDSPVSPVAAPLSLAAPAEKMSMPRKKAVRISAVGRIGMEAGWWDDDG